MTEITDQWSLSFIYSYYAQLSHRRWLGVFDLCCIFLSLWLCPPKCWNESTYKVTNSPGGTKEEFHWHACCTGMVNPVVKGHAEGEVKAASHTVFLTMGSPGEKAAALVLFKLPKFKRVWRTPFLPPLFSFGCTFRLQFLKCKECELQIFPFSLWRKKEGD